MYKSKSNQTKKSSKLFVLEEMRGSCELDSGHLLESDICLTFPTIVIIVKPSLVLAEKGQDRKG